MDWGLNIGALMLLLVTGAFFICGFVDFLRTRSLRNRLSRGDAFSADPKPSRSLRLPPHPTIEYDRAA